MADIRIKITTDTAELKKDVAKSSKLLDRMEKGHAASVKKRAQSESKSYVKIDKTRKKSSLAAVKDFKLIERENQKRLDKEVKAEIDAANKKKAARARFKGFALQAAGQGLGVAGMGPLGAGVGLIGQGGLLGAGAGIAIAALASIAKFVQEIFAFKSKLNDVQLQMRLTNEETKVLESNLDEAAMTVGTTTPKMLDLANAFAAATGVALDPGRFIEMGQAMKISRQSADELQGTLEKLTDRGVKVKDLADTYILLAAAGGDVNRMTKEMDGQYKALDLTNNDNVRTMRELMFLFKGKELDKFLKQMDTVRKGKKGKLREMLEIYKPGQRGRSGMDMKSISELLKNWRELHKMGKLPPFLIDVLTKFDKISLKPVAEEISESLAKRRQDPGEAMERIKQLLFVFTKETVFKGIEAALTGLATFMSKPENIQMLIDTLRTTKDVMLKIAKFLGFQTPEEIAEKKKKMDIYEESKGLSGFKKLKKEQSILPTEDINAITEAIENSAKPVVIIYGAEKVEQGRIDKGSNTTGVLPIYEKAGS